MIEVSPSTFARQSCNPPLVLKFGSSSLRSIDDVKRVAAYVTDSWAPGIKCAVVVSARHGETDRLLDEARQLASEPCHSILPRHVLHGEEQSVSALTMALIGSGVSAVGVSVSELELLATGHPLEAAPIGIRGDIEKRLKLHDVVVVPGFGGWCRDRNRPVLLGRGGSDLTAVLVAQSLGVDEVILIKDVDGVYSADPKQDPQAQRFDVLNFVEARAVVGKLIQGAAIDAAEHFGISIIIRSISGYRESRIGPHSGPDNFLSDCAA